MTRRRDNWVGGAGGGFVWTVLLLAGVATATRGHHHPVWRTGVASAYSRADSPGRMACTSRRVPSDELLVAHKSLACGTDLRICLRPTRCVTARVEDRGPWVPGRVLDLTPGVVHALGFSSARSWGVRRVLWRPL